MNRSLASRASAIVIAGLIVATLARPIRGQQFRTTIEARARTFPAIGPGVTALKRDSSGRYYILAKPATAIMIYDADGNLAGQIPNANSQGATIKYAVDIDLSPDGLLFVADRGSNAVEIFKPDGALVAKVPVNAPTSLAALSNGQFAVTSLTSDRLVQIRDVRGTLVRSFGDPSDIAEDAGNTSMMEWGKISGDSADGIYFALTATSDPTLRKYDRFGYAAYETTVPGSVIDAASTEREDRVQLSVNLSHLSLSEQTMGSITLGSSRDLKFSAGVGTGLLGGMHYRGGYGRAQTGLLQSEAGSSPFGSIGGGPVGGMISGEISDQGPQLHFGLGTMSGIRRGTQGSAGGSSSGQTSMQGTTLQFNASGNVDDLNFSDQDLNGALSSNNLQQGANQDSTNGPFGSASYQAQDAYISDLAGQNFGQSFGLPNDFVIGSFVNSFNFRPPRPPGGFGGGTDSASSGAGNHPAASTGAGSAGTGSAAASTGHTGPGEAGGRGGVEGFRPRGRFGAGEVGVSASIRVNLGDLSNNLTDKPVITAVGVDPVTHEIWAGIGDTLVHFNKTGDPLEIYNLTMKGGTPIKPTAILVEPDRFLIATDPWGIFEFSRPDQVPQPAPSQLNAVPQDGSSPNP